MTALQLAVAFGCLAGLGVTMVVGRLLPATPDLRSAIDRLDPALTGPTASSEISGSGVTSLQDRVGIWAQRRAPATVLGRVPASDLQVLQRTSHRHLGEKTLLALVGLLFPGLFALVLAVIGVQLPVVVPVAGAIALAAGLFLLPDLAVRGQAARARREFIRALASYIDLVALERAAGAGSTQALEAAASVGDSWVFRRIGEVLARSRWSGQAPWDGLKELGEQLGIGALSDLAEIMRLSGVESVSVAGQLRARASSLRSALLNEDLAKANEAGEQMSIPVGMLALIFLAMLAAPAALRMLATA
ncbi:hypothetical protein [Nocardioides sp.]|uniref:hypothetical protein n=1 Tax=Nocardioides sp. TaxID=35761 RepID=UPI0027330BE5|nr:hypothetical protein [Nocardioides sp.]MDP3893631.1 hypothetical protein [Nocardioides sp.]